MSEKRGITLISLIITIITILILSVMTISISINNGFINTAKDSKQETTTVEIKEYGSSVKSTIIIEKKIDSGNIVDKFIEQVNLDNNGKEDSEQHKVVGRIDIETQKTVTLERDGVTVKIDLTDLVAVVDDSIDISQELSKKFKVSFLYKEGDDEKTKTFIIAEGKTLQEYLNETNDTIPENKTWNPDLNLGLEVSSNIVYREYIEKPNKVVASFNLAGGTLFGNSDVESVEYNIGDIVSNIGKPKKEHHNFAGWNPPLQQEINENTTYTAQWSALEYEFVFELNGGSIGGSTSNKIINGLYGEDSSTPADPTRENYTFAGWSPNVPAKFDENRTFTAQWTTAEYTFTFNLNGGTINGSADDKLISGAYNTNSSTPTNMIKDHHTFAGWSPSVPAKFDGNKTFTAQWTPVEYTFTFNLNGGNIDGSTTNKTTNGIYDTNSSTPKNPTRVDYTFAGWTPSVPTKFDGNKTFTAQWTAVEYTYTFTFNLNRGNIGGSTANKTTSGIYNTNSSTPVDPTREHYTFAGWSPSVPTKFDGDKTFTAQWTPVNYTITYNLNGGNIGGLTSSQTRSVPYNTLPPDLTPTRSGYVFLGWTPTLSVVVGNQTYTALWSIPMEIQMKKSTVGESVLVPVTLPVNGFVLISNNGGAYTKYTSNNPTFTNNVAANKAFTVKIAGRINEFTYLDKSTTYTKQPYKLIAWGEIGAKTYRFSRAESVAGSCINLEGPIPSPTSGSFTNIETFELAFTGCVKLNGTIPSGLFSTCVNSTSFWSVFYGCTSLTGNIPANLFAGCTKATSYKGLFALCPGLTGPIPAGLFSSSPNVTNFDFTFTDCSGLTGNIPANLFSVHTKVEEYASTFYGCKNLTGSIPGTLFSKSSEVKRFFQTFYNCTGLTGSIPANLFANKPKVFDYEGTFGECAGLTGRIPGTLFDDSPNAYYMIGTFFRCHGLTEITPDLFSNNLNVGEYSMVFYDCANLTGTAPNIWTRTNVVKHADAFTYCVKLANKAAIPAGWK